MAQSRYRQLLLESPQVAMTWENLVAHGIKIDDLDREEILRFVEASRSAGRLLEPTADDLSRTLDRLNLQKQGRLTNAAVVLFGKNLSDYPQCEIRMARFIGYVAMGNCRQV